MNLSKRNYARLRVALTARAACKSAACDGFYPISYGRLAGFYVDSVRKLRTPSRPPKQKPDAPENQQRQLREVRGQPAAPRLAVRF